MGDLSVSALLHSRQTQEVQDSSQVSSPQIDTLIWKRELPKGITDKFPQLRLRGEAKDIRVPSDNPDEVKTRKGYPATAANPSEEEQMNGIQKAVTVKKEQVQAFLDTMAPYGFGLKESDIYTSKGVLNPNFELKNGKICFKEGMMKKYLEGNAPKYFETYSGQWAEAVEEPSKFPGFPPVVHLPRRNDPWFPDPIAQPRPKFELPDWLKNAKAV